ncbi:hypothetical protein [Aneurinibacillus aneurinilyticus]|uniref:Uncharacterized protein n=1 Tax=Aneurinibacillus aneurinilyticus ATCC 12856 TaxID=649747 RepID=U1W9F5_ANEAE|nr:hypothetical protein [Aneurinibacillus aneurinilyticus]MBJ3773672.1 hypothetical protein [Klebsiella pneumoniae]ERI05149.1 hypothetical protein HMPREF0083_05722 [Aneurinibacillus aneurinilyticus ATCC 12856]MED0708188.1 hypothetical protein [Aneurinibacillus aneurinilyticus]MED0721459.1 hypothetical protein [Aneurinibacillus aneurinilyticus]MED0734073.1 hypothetical protein [Aneurinibacillus aneurinilyticus]
MIIINEKPLSQIEKEREEAEAPMLTMGQEMALLKLGSMQKDTIIQTLGQELARVKLELIRLKEGE